MKEIVDYKLGIHGQQIGMLGNLPYYKDLSSEIVSSLESLLPDTGSSASSILFGNTLPNYSSNLPKMVEILDSNNKSHIVHLNDENAKTLDFISLQDNSTKYNNGSFQFQEPNNLRFLQSVIIKDSLEKSLVNTLGGTLGSYLKNSFLYTYSKMIKINDFFLKEHDPLKI